MTTRLGGARLYGALGLMVVLSVVLFWIVGFLPWVLAGFTVPARQAGGPTAGVAGVRLAVPLVVPRLPELVACALLGGVLAGIVPIAFPRVSRLLCVVLTGCVVLASTTAVLVVSRRALDQHASAQFAGAPRVVEGLVLAVVCAAALGLVVGLAATVRHGLVSIAAGLAAAALPAWLAALPGLRRGAVVDLAAAAVLLVGLVVSVHRTRRSALLWPLAVVLGWAGTPFTAGAVYLAERVRPDAPAAVGTLARGAAAAARSSLDAAPDAWWPWAVAAVLAGAFLLLPRPEPVLIAPDRRKHTATRRS